MSDVPAIRFLASLSSEGLDDKRFRALGEKTVQRPEVPAFLFGTPPESVFARYYATVELHAPGVFLTKQVRLSDGYLISSGDRAYCVPESNIHPVYINDLLPNSRARRNPSPRRRQVANPCALIAGPGVPVYGHWLVDLLPKIALLYLAGFDLKTLCFPLPASTPKFALNWLAALQIGLDQILLYEEDELLEIDTLLIPTTLHNGVRVSRLFADASEYFLKTINIPRRPRGRVCLFLSRAKASQSRQLKNRDTIERLADHGGLTIVHPESLPLREQVALFAEAKEIVGEYGSAMHGSIFAPPGALIACMRGSEFHPAFIQSGLGLVLEQPTGYIFGATEEGHAVGGPCEVPEEAFSDYLTYARALKGTA